MAVKVCSYASRPKSTWQPREMRSPGVALSRLPVSPFTRLVALPEDQICSEQTRAWLAGDTVQLSPAARQRIAARYRMLDATNTELVPLKKEIERFGRRQPACVALAKPTMGSAR